MAGPRFSGTLVEDDAAPAPAGPRFSGTLVEDDAPASAEGGRAHGALNAFARGVVNGLPIVGPYALAGIDRADAAVRAVQNDSRYSDEVDGAKRYGAEVAAEHPIAETAGGIGGGIVGTAPLVLAAPAAFGAGAGGLMARSAASAFSGGILGTADAAVRSGGDAKETLKGGVAGATLGAAAPGLGQAVGAGARKIAEAVGMRAVPSAGMGAPAMEKLAADTSNAGGTGAVRVRLGELGPEAMLLDASPSFEGRAQGLAVLPDTREAIVDPLRQRAAGANARLAADVDQHLGPTMDPAAFAAEWQNAYREAVPPLYQQALGQPVQVDTSPVLETIGRMGAQEKGGAELALRRAWGLLHAEQEVPGLGRAVVPDRRPEALHNAKEALDSMIAHVQAQQGSAAASELRALSAVRSGVNDALEAQVPGYAEANRTAQHFFQQRDAFDAGQRLLNGGREAARPAQVAADTAAMTPEVQQAQRLGLRTEVDRLVGTQLNDRLALRKALMGEGDYNRARMGTVFGEEPTAGMAAAVDREAAFDATHQNIVRNSQTAQRTAAAADLAPRDVRPSASDAVPAVAAAVGGVQAGLAAQAAKLGIKGAQAGLNAAGRARDIARNKELAEALTRRQGEQLDALLEAIGARQAAERMASGVGRAAQIGTTAATVSQADRARAYVPFGFLPAVR
ncbi:hypothetical protein ABID82_002366 [Methylobacterium sp. PvP062]|uniref:Uncharacterized protein n=1 Tax=Methylobacterium radiotolerans TaxID=31998 RepID=A0ABV2NNK9_9HYPH|nr:MULTISPECIES: hypothetical protein [unclassified Methylobacterium]MBP2495302.1 hypothetical protein [Methylobacterium sp. PvP105]MBP2504827.1 hypothetical protein [Methylobacterium sp. PvP109]MCX7335834.1 hypothetical protein [Hyphomicrobiales bacterium]